jgi:hypothetical protein
VEQHRAPCQRFLNDREAGAIGEALRLDIRQTGARAVAAAGIGGDEQHARLGSRAELYESANTARRRASMACNQPVNQFEPVRVLVTQRPSLAAGSVVRLSKPSVRAHTDGPPRASNAGKFQKPRCRHCQECSRRALPAIAR